MSDRFEISQATRMMWNVFREVSDAGPWEDLSIKGRAKLANFVKLLFEEITNLSKEDVLTTKDVAILFKVARTSVIRYCDRGEIRYFRTPGGHRRFYRSDVQKFIDAHIRNEVQE